MNKFKYLFFTLLLFFIFFINVDADTCDSNDIKRLKEITKNVNVSYEYEKDDDGIFSFFVTVSSLTDELYGEIVDGNSIVGFEYNNENLGTIIKKVNSGYKLLSLYSTNCDSELLRKVEVPIPYYNIFSVSDECSNINGDDLYVCSEITDKEITESIFKKEIANYENNINENNINTSNSNIVDFLKSYFVWFIILIVFVVIIIILLKNQKNRSVLD